MGGNIFSGTSSISMKQVPGVLKLVREKVSDATLVGSSGLVAVSGDIDILTCVAVDKLVELFAEYPLKRQGASLSVQMPVPGEDTTVQVDFFVVDILDRPWSEFYYRGPRNSKFKGRHRNILLGDLLGFLDRKTSEELDFFGRPMTTERYKLTNHGVQRVIRESIYQNGKCIKKQKDTILYHSADIEDMVYLIFGITDTTVLQSVETIVAAVKDNYSAASIRNYLRYFNDTIKFAKLDSTELADLINYVNTTLENW